MPTSFRSRVTSLLAVIGCVLAIAAPVRAAQPSDLIVLPGASSAEGIAKGSGSTFYAGDLFAGDIFRGDLQTGTVERFIDNPPGRMAVGMFADIRHGLLFVAGGSGANGYVYDTGTGATLATYPFGNPGTLFINDVTVTGAGAWFTDSLHATLYFVPVNARGELGSARSVPIAGPASDTSGEFNLNGITATPNGKTLIVAHSGKGALYAVDPTTGMSTTIAGVSVPNVDGITLEAGRLWAVQNMNNQVARIRLAPDLTSGVVEGVITDDAFQIPTTVIRFGDRLAVVNAKFDTGIPPTAAEYEVVLVDR